MPIDTTTYRKDHKHPVGYGYDRRASAVSAVVVHTTSNGNKTAFATEARYLLDSEDVSAHYLIGKSPAEGVVQFLPDTFRAWHAGKAMPPFGNDTSVGIELHVSSGEHPTAYQVAALTNLVTSLMSRYTIPLANIDTHRAVALPAGRKSDPTGWADTDFYAWRAALAAPPAWVSAWSAKGTPPPPPEQYGWAIPQVYQRNYARLGACLHGERYSQGGAVSVATFERGELVYLVSTESVALVLR